MTDASLRSTKKSAFQDHAYPVPSRDTTARRFRVEARPSHRGTRYRLPSKRRQARVALIGLWLGSLLAVLPTVEADLLVIRDQGEPVPGLLVSQLDDEIQFRVRLPDGQTQVKAFAAGDVMHIIRTIDPQALDEWQDLPWADQWELAETLLAIPGDAEAYHLGQGLLREMLKEVDFEWLASGLERLPGERTLAEARSIWQLQAATLRPGRARDRARWLLALANTTGSSGTTLAEISPNPPPTMSRWDGDLDLRTLDPWHDWIVAMPASTRAAWRVALQRDRSATVASPAQPTLQTSNLLTAVQQYRESSAETAPQLGWLRSLEQRLNRGEASVLTTVFRLQSLLDAADRFDSQTPQE